ncbi:hypothetical protein [Marinoscillum pacificum]|uniref:hypothetical protein n=1 Tax=Marinoscillum pacificum TaxID=392723 RepID=UPI0021585DAA|nr:hypothetical protein [Marinoscillum pacificum]
MGSRQIELFNEKKEMVSLEERSNYILYVKERPKLKAFYSLLYTKQLIINHDARHNETEIIYYDLLSSLLEKDKNQFNKSYNIISKRQPSRDSISPFVHDDFLIFILILGIKIYNINRDWITNIINIRNRNPITITFENILNDNFASTSNCSEVIVSFLKLYNTSFLSHELLNKSYDNLISNDTLLEEQNDILILCSLRAFDTIIEMSKPANGSEIEFLKNFESKFINRLKILSLILYNATMLGLLFLVSKLISQLPNNILDQLKQYNLIIGTIGAGILSSNFFKAVRHKITSFIGLLLGYNSEKIESIRNDN